jgi:cytochrome c-type biogenesis protein CcmH/NrfG
MKLRCLVAGLLCLASLPSFALSDSGQKSLQMLQSRWAEINYQLPKEQREAAFAVLAAEAETQVRNNPKDAEFYIWRGIVLSTYAGAKGGLGALDLVKQSKTSLEQALALNPDALYGSAYTSLGALYYQVPGWPVGFGDDEQAEKMLKQALQLNPNGIDPNYFYADFLFRQERYSEAKVALEKALAAAPRVGREVADQGRRAEVSALLTKVQDELK